MMDRRNFLKTVANLSTGALAGTSGFALAGEQGAKGPQGFRNAAAGGFGPRKLTRISGRAPASLRGTLYRNGPGHFRRGDTLLGHWFDGDGFLRAFRIGGDEAELTARFADTSKRRQESAAGEFIMPGFGSEARPGARVSSPDSANAANTSVLLMGDQIWALWEAGSPYALDADDLTTAGPITLRDDLAHMPFSAHPKISPDGHIWNFGLAGGQPVAFIWTLAPDGSLKKAEIVNLPRASYFHDWAMTETKLVIPLQPWVLDSNRPPYVSSLEWRPDESMLVMVIDKDDFSRQRIFELPAGFYYHTADAFEDADGTIRFDIALAHEPTIDAADGRAIVRGERVKDVNPHMTMAVLNVDGSAHFERTGHVAEFPCIDPRLQGARRAEVYSITEGSTPAAGGYTFNAVMSFNWDTGKRDIFDFGGDHLIEEQIFVPHPERAGSGWLVGTTLNRASDRTELHVFDAAAIADGPVVSWHTDVAMPLGFHGAWRPA